MTRSTVCSLWTISMLTIILRTQNIEGLACWECAEKVGNRDPKIHCNSDNVGYPVTECDGACGRGFVYLRKPTGTTRWWTMLCSSSIIGLEPLAPIDQLNYYCLDLKFDLNFNISKGGGGRVLSGKLCFCNHEDYCWGKGECIAGKEGPYCNETIPEKDECANFNQLDRYPEENCQSCVSQPNCVYARKPKKCVSSEKATENKYGYHDNIRDCINDCNLYILPNRSPAEVCKFCITGQYCEYYLGCNGWCAVPQRLPGGDVPSQALSASQNSTNNKYSSQCGFTNIQCRHISREVFDIDSCIKCTSNPDCAFMVDTGRGHNCVEWDYAVLDSKKYIDYHRVPTECHMDCQLHIKNGSHMENCVSCTRNDSNCVYLRKSNQCWLEKAARKRGFEAGSDFFQQETECLNINTSILGHEHDCDHFNIAENSPQENCQLCTSNQNCVFRVSDKKGCLAKNKAVEDQLSSINYYENPKQCSNDCGLAITSEQSVFEACVTCLEFNNPCQFYIWKTGLFYECKNDLSLSYSGGLLITDLRNCSLACVGKPSIALEAKTHDPRKFEGKNAVSSIYRVKLGHRSRKIFLRK